jgi:adenine/guanine phosphoribosyltransferase-like PRPP-binding protein
MDDRIVSIEEVNYIVDNSIVPKLKKLDIDCVLAVCPSGYAFSKIILDRLMHINNDNLLLSTVDVESFIPRGIKSKQVRINKISEKYFGNVLIVDSVISTGKTVNAVQSFINSEKTYVLSLFNKSLDYNPYYICGSVCDIDTNLIFPWK